MKDENISAFACNTGKLIEKIIDEATDNIAEENRQLKGKIMQWYAQTKDEDFKEYFGITSHLNGRV